MNVKNAAVNPRATTQVQIWFSAADSDSGRRAPRKGQKRSEGPEEACFGTLAAHSITLDCCRAESQWHWEAGWCLPFRFTLTFNGINDL